MRAYLRLEGTMGEFSGDGSVCNAWGEHERGPEQADVTRRTFMDESQTPPRHEDAWSTLVALVLAADDDRAFLAAGAEASPSPTPALDRRFFNMPADAEKSPAAKNRSATQRGRVRGFRVSYRSGGQTRLDRKQEKTRLQ